MSDSMPPASSGAHPPAGPQQHFGQQPAVPPQPPSAPGQQPGQPPEANQSAGSGGGKPLLFGGIGVVVGLLVGVLAGSTLLGGGGSGSGGGAADDAALACSYASSIAEDFDPDALALDDPLIWQLQAAGGLAQAAATADPAYATLGEQGMELYEGATRLDAELLEETLQAMDENCQSI